MMYQEEMGIVLDNHFTYIAAVREETMFTPIVIYAFLFVAMFGLVIIIANESAHAYDDIYTDSNVDVMDSNQELSGNFNATVIIS